MIRGVLTTATWMTVVDAFAALAVVGFLYTPDANVLMLGVSALLVLAAVLLLLVASTSAAQSLVHAQTPWRSLPSSLRLLPLVLFGVVVIGVLCGGAGAFESWWVSRAGEIDAAAIAVGDVTRTRPLHTAVHWLVLLVQWVVVPAWLATCLAWVAAYERRDVLGSKWLASALHWRVLLAATAGVVLLVWLPWRYVYWRPGALPSSMDLVFLALKIAVIYVLAHVAWALVLWTAAARVTPQPKG